MFTSQDVKTALSLDEAYDRPQYPVAVLRSYISYKLGRVKSAALVVDKLKYIELDLVSDGGMVHLCGAFAAIRDEYILGYSSVPAIRRLQRSPATLRAMARSGSLPFGENEEAAPAFDDGAGLAFAPPSYVQATDAASDERKYRRAKRAARTYERRLVESEAARRTAEVAWRAAEEARAEAEDEKERLAEHVRRLEAVVAGRAAWPVPGQDDENVGRKLGVGEMGLYNAWTDADAGASDEDVFGRVEVPASLAPLAPLAPPKPPRSVRRKPAPSLILPSLPALDNLSLLARDE